MIQSDVWTTTSVLTYIWYDFIGFCYERAMRWGPWCWKNWSYQSASQIRTSWWCSVSVSSGSVIHECAINDSAANGIAQWTLFSLMQCLDELGLCLCLSSYQEVRHWNHEIYVSWSLASVDISFIDLDMKLLRCRHDCYAVNCDAWMSIETEAMYITLCHVYN